MRYIEYFLVLTMLLILVACRQEIKEVPKELPQANPFPGAENNSNESISVLMIIVQKDFRDEELQKPRQIMESNGIKVNVASIEKKQATGMLGLTVMPDLAVRDARPDDYTAIIVVGGAGAPELANHQEIIELVQEAYSKNKLVAAICLGPTVLARAGVLEGKRATAWTAIGSMAAKDVLEENGASFVKESLVVDGNIITANGPEAAEEFGNKLVEMLKE